MLLAETSQACRLIAQANRKDVRLFGGYRGPSKIRVLRRGRRQRFVCCHVSYVAAHRITDGDLSELHMESYSVELAHRFVLVREY